MRSVITTSFWGFIPIHFAPRRRRLASLSPWLALLLIVASIATATAKGNEPITRPGDSQKPSAQANAQSEQGEYIPVSSGVKYQLIGTYDVDRLNKILTTELADFTDFKVTYPPARYPVKLYRVQYNSVIPEQNNRPTLASGLIAIPDTGEATMPVVSYQHGTVFSKTEVPSNPEESMETRLMIAQFAGQGYIVVAADYFGKGVSVETDSYTVKASAQQACLDMLFAARAILEDMKLEAGPFFLSGWSQGGWTTMVFLNKLESLDIPVAATAIASAPVDLFAQVNRWMHAPSSLDAVYLPGVVLVQIYAYEQYYGLPGLAQTAIKPEYEQTAHDLYLNNITFDEAAKVLPATVDELLQSDFLAASSIGESRYYRIVQDNHAYRWRARTPVHTYYGDIDEVVPPYIATLPVGYQETMGGATVTAVASGSEANHRGNFVYAVADQIKWFDELLSN